MALTAAWLFLGATPVRTAVLWGSLALLTACVVIWAVAVKHAGAKSRSETYQWAVQAASVRAGSAAGTIPLRLGGTRRMLVRSEGLLVAGSTLVALWATLIVADARGTGTSAVLADAGAVIEQRAVVKIEKEDAGSSFRSSATADYTVLLPPSSGGEVVPVTFRADTHRRQGIGSKLYVASVPGQPELGAIGDDQLAEVERQLAGRALEHGSAWLIGAVWVLATLAMGIGSWATGSLRRPARTVDPAWQSLRVAVSGTGEHTDEPPPGSPDAADEKKRRENTRKLPCLVLEGRGREIPFHVPMGLDAAGAALTGVQGWLLWHPQQRRGEDVLAELVGDDGWQLPGAVPVQVAERVEEAGVMEPARPDPERRVQTLDLGAGWLVTASAPVVVGFAVALACLTALLLVPDGGAWRVWTAVAGVLAPLAGLTVQAVARMDHGDGDTAEG
ncbi:hypothetical protein ACGFWE_36540 [Streptomyces sp. NPDC048523]|uniref:hypothetical protein n=1 Tax=Streptomyces sp. NPDC048523 TaxID=3365567 RepID=UPI003710494F